MTLSTRDIKAIDPVTHDGEPQVTDWHRWFAWYPVRLSSGGCVWMRWVECRLAFEGFAEAFDDDWEYRTGALVMKKQTHEQKIIYDALRDMAPYDELDFLRAISTLPFLRSISSEIERRAAVLRDEIQRMDR